MAAGRRLYSDWLDKKGNFIFKYNLNSDSHCYIISTTVHHNEIEALQDILSLCSSDQC